MGKHSKRDDIEFWAAQTALDETEHSAKPPQKQKRPPHEDLKQTEFSSMHRKQTKVNYPNRTTNKVKQSWWAAPMCAVTGGLLFVLVAAGIFSCMQYGNFREMRAQVQKDAFYAGITVDGEDMSGKTLEQALGEWAKRDEDKKDAYRVELTIGNGQWLITPDDVGYQSDYMSILKSAWSVGRYGTLSARYDAVTKTAGAWSREYHVTSGADEARMSARLDAIATAASEPGTAAQITGFDAQSKGFTFVEGTEGLAVDARELKEAFLAKAQSGGGSLTVERHTVLPAQTLDVLKKTFGMVASCKTSAKSSSNNRLINLKLACEALNGLRVEPGEVISYNQVLGKRTAEKGYKKAPAVSGGAHTMQIGGGICQVSTTLFNAIARADLAIVKRYPHTIPSTYVPRGMDATVNWPNQDFQFKNTSDFPIYLVASLTKDKQVVVEVHGKKLDDGITIKLKGKTNGRYSASEPKYVMVNDLPTGETRVVESKRSGYVVTTYRVYEKNGKEIKTEQLFKSSYPSSGGIIEVGR